MPRKRFGRIVFRGICMAGVCCKAFNKSFFEINPEEAIFEGRLQMACRQQDARGRSEGRQRENEVATGGNIRYNVRKADEIYKEGP